MTAVSRLSRRNDFRLIKRTDLGKHIDCRVPKSFVSLLGASAGQDGHMVNVFDPFCGAGTMLILKLMMALGVVLGFMVLLVVGLK